MAGIGIIATFAVSRIKDAAPARDALPPIGQQFGEFWALFRRNPRLRWASLAIIVLHAHVATSPFVQLWLHEDKGLETAAANSLYGLMFIPFGLIGSIGAGVLADWAHRRFHMDRASSAFGMLILLVPFILAYRMMPASSAFFIPGMAASILFMTMIYGPLFSVIEEQLPPHLKATATGLNMLTLNILMIGGLALAIGVISQHLADTGASQSWTMPLLLADLIAFCGLPMIWWAARSRRSRRARAPSTRTG
jgi:predicted MFS family arabinose efflux permease